MTLVEGEYPDRKKEMERLIKLEEATTPEVRIRKEVELRKGEMARRVAARQPSWDKEFSEDESATAVSTTLPSPDAFSSQEIQVATDLDTVDMVRALTEKVGLPYANIKDFDLESPEAEKNRSFIPASIARERRIFPIKEVRPPGGRPILTIAISDPLNITIVDDLRLLLPEHEIEPVVINEDDIVDAIDRYYGVGDESLDDVIDAMGEESEPGGGHVERSGEVEIDLEKLANDPPVIKLVNLLLVQAIQDRASDLHIEPFAGQLRIRYRVDGVLREIPSPPKSLQVGLISRLKVMAQMNISETRTPQDGRIRLSISGKEIDLRVASVPTVHGESIVMRVLDKSTMMIGVRQLGFQKEVLDIVLDHAGKPNGILLVTGPTGCGKTTTLYSILNEIFDSGLKFITTEDPVEYELPGIVQVNINAKVQLTFAACLRSILRQDPDVILVGEIRDVETAQIAIQAALTGHMVFSTLHTNSAAATVTRLVDMGIESFLLTSTLRCVVAQRLVRTICPSCKEPYIPTDEELDEFAVAREEVEDIVFYVGRGCDVCNFTGYKGRLGIFECLEITEEIRELILQQSTTDEIHALAVHQGMQTMRSDGWLKICLGATTFEEISRQTPRESEESARLEMESAKRSMVRIEAARRKREAEDRRGFADEEEALPDFGVPQVVPPGQGGPPPQGFLPT
ncbi:type II/IV secretion system protein, partial [Candidatus Poribacteria bacterium]|nr:type II/IV secretion system protein [Candidatus Poribacteria bacterium]